MTKRVDSRGWRVPRCVGMYDPWTIFMPTNLLGSPMMVTDQTGAVVQDETGATYNKLVYDGYGNLVFIHDQTNWLQDTIPFYGHRPIARYHNGNTEFLHGDALGSSVYVTEQPGWVLQKLLYYPWGQW